MKETPRKPGLHHEIVANIREIIFGVEDGLVSTLGAVTGIAVGSGSSFIVILSGIVIIFVESLSMSAGSYLSSKTAEESREALHGERGDEASRPIRAAAVMGAFYFIGGSFPILPYLLLPLPAAIIPSVILTAITLFVFGAWSARYTKRIPYKAGLEMVTVAMAAAVVGFIAGRIVSIVFGVEVAA